MPGPSDASQCRTANGFSAMAALLCAVWDLLCSFGLKAEVPRLDKMWGHGVVVRLHSLILALPGLRVCLPGGCRGGR